MSTGFVRKLDPPHSFPFVTNPRAILNRPIPFSELSAPFDLSGRILNSTRFFKNFSIENFSDVLLWFDANDRSTITLNNSKVVSWKSKVNNYVLTLKTPQYQFREDPFLYTQNNNTTLISPVEYPLEIDSISTRMIFTLAIVFSSPSGLIDYNLDSFLMYTANNNLLYLNKHTETSYWISIKDIDFINGVTGALTPVTPKNQLCILIIGYDLTYKAVPYRINGVNRDSRQPIVFDAPQTTNYRTSKLTMNIYLEGSIDKPYIGEIIHFDSNITMNEVEKVEGYLAEKWNLQDKLPETHPYKMKGPNSI
jgi:hypothetical protein